jgi:heme o synthase
MYRADYEHVHFPMLPVRDPSGGKVARWSFVNTVAVVIVSALPTFFGLTSVYYFVTTVLLGAWFIARSIAFLRVQGREKAARKLFLASVSWLPLQMIALVADRWLAFGT